MSGIDRHVEVPLDPQYLTADGIYMAGYIWGKHVRSPEDLRTLDLPEDFIRGVEDGYGDAMLEWNVSINERKEENEKRRKFEAMLFDMRRGF